MEPKTTFNWNITEFMFKSFLSAPNKKCWESQQFGQWVLGCYPNGHTKNDKGNAMLYLKCLGLPPSIYGAKIRYTLHCSQTNLKWSYVQHYNYANTNYANATFKTDTLHSLKSLNFEITIIILKLYDLNRKEVPISDVRKYLKMPSPSLVTLPLDENKKNTDEVSNAEETNDDTLETGDKATLIPFDIYGTIQGIRDKLIGISNKERDTAESENHNNHEMSNVQQQVDIYSKELQSMNREIHLIRKGFKELETKHTNSAQGFQTVLKQVKMIKDEVIEFKLKNDGNNEENETMDHAGNEVCTRLDEMGHALEQMKEGWSEDIKELKGNVKGIESVKQQVVELQDEYKALDERLKVNDDQLVQQITHLKQEIKTLKTEKIENERNRKEEMKRLNEENKAMKE
eukprot:244541_1